MADIDDTANYPEEFRTNLSRLKSKWKAALKRNKKLLLKCPNYEKCQFKCGSVGGMNYHYIRCEGVAPTFKCTHCSRQYESRTGLNYHMMSSHTGDSTQECEVETPPSRPVRSTSSPAKPHLQVTPPPQKTPPTPQKTPPATQKATPTPLTASPLAKPKKPPGRRGKGERGRKPGKSSTITIPSIEYPDEYKSYLPQWRVEMKDNKIIKCPNYQECGFKCTTVNGMKYHYVRCNKDNPPEFNCEVCNKKFQCRTGLVWHLKKHHKLVDIHPTRGGGFKGTLPTNASLDSLLEPGEPTVVGKKISRRGEEGDGRPKRVLLQSNGEGQEELFSRKRLRKSNFPRRTAEDILQNINMCVLPPTPKLGPQHSKFPMPPVEFLITDSIPTDVNQYGSTVICLGEEALVWQKMYSDSEDESDTNHSVDREFKFQASASSSPTASDQSSDEDYSCSLTRKKRGRGRPRAGQRRAVKEREREAKVRDKMVEESQIMHIVQPPEDQKPALDRVLLQSKPPPLLIKQEKQVILPKPERQIPDLIKASKGTKRSREPKDDDYVPPSLLGKIKPKEKLKTQVQVQPQVQPVPPGLIKQHPKMRQPPPLVKKSEVNWSGKAQGDPSHRSSAIPSIGAASGSKTATKGYSTSISDLIASSSSSFPPRKEVARVSEYQGPTVQKPVSQLGESKAHYRAPKPITVQASSYSMKGFKGTPVELQSGTPHSGGTYHHTPSSSAVPLQNIVTPMQIVQGVPPGHNVMQMPTYQNVTQLPPGVILVQGPTGIPGEIPYFTQGGQTYQLLSAQSQGEGSQKVSVIMNPSNYQYFTQLDGPPSQTKSKKQKDTKQLRERFEAARKEEQAKLTHSLEDSQESPRGTSDLELNPNDPSLHHRDDPSVSTTLLDTSSNWHTGAARIESESESSQCLSSTELTHEAAEEVPSSESRDYVGEAVAKEGDGIAASDRNSPPDSRTHSTEGSSGTETAGSIRKSYSSEDLMTEQLKSYFKKGERARKAKCFSPPFEENPPVIHQQQLSQPQEVAVHLKKKGAKRARSVSVTSSRSVSVSPVPMKSPKSPRLIVSPTLFSPAGAQLFEGGCSPLGVTPSPMSGRSSKSPRLSTSPPLCSPVDPKPARPMDAQAVSSGSSVPVHLPLSKPTKSVTSAKKKDQKRLTSPDLSNLFLPDNLPHAGPAPETRRPPAFEPHQGPSVSKRPLEFSSTLPQGHASSLKKPIPLKGDDDFSKGTCATHHSSRNDPERIACSTSGVPVQTTGEESSRKASHDSLLSLDLVLTAAETTGGRDTFPTTEKRVIISCSGIPAGNTNSSNSTDASESSSTHDSQKSSPSGSSQAGSHASDNAQENPNTDSSQKSAATSGGPGDGTEASDSPKSSRLGKRKKSSPIGGDPLTTEDSLPPAKKRGRGRPRKVAVTAVTISEKPDDGSVAKDFPPPAKKRGRGRPRKTAVTLDTPSESQDSSSTTRGLDLGDTAQSGGADILQVTEVRDASQGTSSPSAVVTPEPSPLRRGRPQKKATPKKKGRPRQTKSLNQSPPADASRSPSLTVSDLQSPEPSVSIPPASKKKRGRPRKIQPDSQTPESHPDTTEQSFRSQRKSETPMDVDVSDSQSLDSESTSVSTPPLVIGKSNRGRPRKIPQSVMSDSQTLAPESASSPTPPTKRKRGRPSKTPPDSGSEPPHTPTSQLERPSPEPESLLTDNVAGPSQADVTPETPAKKKRGRPKLSDGPRLPSKNARFSCSKCSKGYSSQQALDAHVANLHPPALGKDASMQEYMALWRKLLRASKSITCPKCTNFRCSIVQSMKYHYERCGKSVEEMTIHCPKCGKAYKSQPGLDYHTKMVHQPAPSQEVLPKPGLFEKLDISQPLPPRQAATRAGDRLQQLAQEMTESEKGEASTSQQPQSTGDGPADSSGVTTALIPADTDSNTATSEVGVQTVSFKKPPQQQEIVGSQHERTPVPGFTAAQMASFRKKIKEEKSMKCPFQECQKDFSTIQGLYYHLRHHDSKTMPCPICGRILQGQRRLDNHLRAKHGDSTQLEDALDEEYNPNDSPKTSGAKGSVDVRDRESDSDEEMAEDWEAELEALRTNTKPQRQVDHSHRLGMAHIQRCVTPSSYKMYQNTVREVVQTLFSQEQLFVDWQPQLSHWARAQPQELPSHLPLPVLSLPFSFCPTTNDPQQDHTLPLFATMATEHSSIMLFAGGPVWALDWLPVPEPAADQYMALVTHKDLDETFPIDVPLAHKGLIQLWNIGQLSNEFDELDALPRPRLELGVAHEWGCIRALRWCPSGSWVTQGEEGLPRLGLLGIACSDGVVRILSIPHPCKLLSKLPASDDDDHPFDVSDASHLEGEATSLQEPLFVKALQVSATLIPSGLGMTDWSKFGQCLCMDWLPGDRHSRIAAGFSNGAVCIWDLHSHFLRQQNCGPGHALHPLIQLVAHTTECRCLAWCPLNSNYLFTGGQDNLMNLWDVREPHEPQQRQRRVGLFREAYWPLLWCGIFSVEDQSGLKPSGVTFTSYLHQQLGTRGLAQTIGPIAGASYCIWTDRIASGSFCGELHTITVPSNFYVSTYQKPKVSPMCQYHCKLESLDNTTKTAAEREPLSSLDDRPSTSETQAGSGPDLNTANSYSMADNSQTDTKTNESDSILLFSKEVSNTHRILFIHKPTKEQLPKSYSVDSNPITSINKVSWNPNEHSYEWLLAATNCGLVHLLRVPKPIHKPYKAS